MTTKNPKSRSRIFHVPKGVAYKIEDSPIGLQIANALGFVWIDLDWNITKDGVVVCGHWPRIKKDKFVLPAWFVKKYGNDPRIDQVLWDDLQELRTVPLKWKKRKYIVRYYSIGEIFELMVEKYPRLKMAMEVKGDRRFQTDDVWDRIIESAERKNFDIRNRLQVMTLSNLGTSPALRLAPAKARGLKTIILARGSIPVSWEKHIDYVRGRWSRNFKR